MEPTVVVFVAVTALAVLLLPRRWASLPLIVGACCMARVRGVDIGVGTLTAVLILITVGIARVVIRREWIHGELNSLDWLMIGWGLWMVASVAFHEKPETPVVLRIRNLYEAWGLYLLFRVFCRSREDVKQLARILALVLVPVAVAMVAERWTGMNLFAGFGGVPEFSAIRNGVVRSQGPFAHAILAGSVGGVCLPLMAGLWRDRRFLSLLGITACTAMVITSGSSGPILAAGAGVGVLLLWPLHERMRLVRWAAVLLYLALDVCMNRPAYFLISDIDLMGGSTSWHRAQLIRSTFEHIGEWWLAGTDYTRHWMPTGVPSSPNQTDITNHYIGMAVMGGLPLMLLFIGIIAKGFWNVGDAIRAHTAAGRSFSSWIVGASLFAHAVTCFSVSYYDTSVIFLYLTLAATTATLSSVTIRSSLPADTDLATARAPRLPRYRNTQTWAPGRRAAAVQRFAPRDTVVLATALPTTGRWR